MPSLHIVSSAAAAGKTALAVAVAQGLSETGRRVRLLRAGSDAAAHEDASSFEQYPFASMGAGPVAVASLPAAPAGQILVIEMPAGTLPPGGPAMVALRAAPTEADKDLARNLGDRLIGSIALQWCRGKPKPWRAK
jgi:hypothetical protein